ncbi:arginase family protein [Fibrella aestuarina]|nr:arginase family protein [Fibrella aestuarina]
METLVLPAETQYTLSACLSVRSRSAGNYQIAHLLTGKQYQITADVARILALLQKTATPSQLCDALPDLPPTAIDRTIRFLTSEKLIIDAAHSAHEDLFHINQLTNRLFNLPDHQRRSEDPGVVFIGVPYGGGNGISPGCDRFPSVVRAYTKQQKINLGPDANLANVHFRGLYATTPPTRLTDRLLAGDLRDWGDLLFFPFESATDVYAKIGRAVQLTAQRGQVPVLLGGDHSISYAGIQAITEQYGAIQVLHFDAHCDTYESSYNRLYARRGAHSHGTFMSRSLELPGLKRVTQIGLRGFTNISQHDTSRRHILWAEDARQALIANTLPTLPTDWPVYVTFDIDVLDPAVAPGTATPVPGGFSYDEVCHLLAHFLQGQRVVGVDLVEVNPDRDRDQVTVQTAAQLLLLLASYVV